MQSNNSKQIKFGALISYISIFVNIIMGLVYTPWMIKQIGQSDYALYTLATSIITMFAIDFGLSAAVSRFVAKYVAEGNTTKVNEFLGVVYKLYFGISAAVLFILLIIYIFLGRIYISLSETELERFRIIYAIAGMYSVVSFPFVTFNGIMTAYEQFIQLKLCDLFSKIGTVIFVVLALYSKLGLFSLVIANVVVGLITIFIKYIIIKKNTPIRVDFRYFNKSILKDVFKFSIWSTLGSFAQHFLIVIAPSILAKVSNTTQVAIFGFANSIGSYVCLLATAIDGSFLPQISRIIANKNEEQRLLPLMIKVGRFQVYILGLIAIGFFIVGKEFVILLMGKEYLEAYYCVLCYIGYAIFSYPQQIGNTALIAKNYVKDRAIVSVVAAIINVILSFILSYSLGSIGTCISLFIAICARTIMLDVLYSRKLHINVFKYFKKCHVPLLISFAVEGICCYFICSMIKSSSWLIFGYKVIIILAVFAMGSFIVMNPEEKSYVRSILNHFSNTN